MLNPFHPLFFWFFKGSIKRHNPPNSLNTEYHSYLMHSTLTCREKKPTYGCYRTKKFISMFSLVFNHLKIRLVETFYIYIGSPPCFYSSPEWTKETLDLERAISVLHAWGEREGVLTTKCQYILQTGLLMYDQSVAV